MRGVALALLGFCLASAANAQSLNGSVQTERGADATMAELLVREYEIKSAVPNGSKLIVFMQKGTSAYACEFVNVAKTRCASIN
ncbi:hypothetical protein [Rhizobium sp. SSA_523]|uniref:hypothetical protein n=1 Tax=Rhizobium sp. SSA_523 TaxID=2952477 RepID=UPI0020916052|nr:hypothetical protein [Rhizobium sp. SSA_523]MCO5730645.1 hypothetical protein [Rhizobium sp. SSA_523]WKC24525.1 hypothetical protein QTJ18_10760 [Rhizobium sp. SSA_523]